MNMRDGEQLHDVIGFVGLRAHATAVGLIQLSNELLNAGVIDAAALDRVKLKIVQDLALSRPPNVKKDEFENQLKQRLDQIFAS